MKKHFQENLQDKFWLLTWKDDDKVLKALLDLTSINEVKPKVLDQLDEWYTSGKGLPKFLLANTNQELTRFGLPELDLVDDGFGEILYGPARYARRQKALEALSATWTAPAYTIPQAKPTKAVAKPKKAVVAPAPVATQGNPVSQPTPFYSKAELIEALLEGIEQMQKQLAIDIAIIAALKEVE